jgi:acetaldehyde dehydrogenase (acetylating)
MKFKVGILGTGNIGTDLLFKILKLDFIEVIIFAGRRYDSDGIKIAKSKNITVTDKGIQYFIDNPKCCDLVYDCTNSEDAKKHAPILKSQGIKVIDLTPAKIGSMCVPYVNNEIILKEDNINMITCGGQSSIPLLHVLSNHCDNIEYIEIVSQIASKSAGMATRINVDDYIKTTKKAITQFTNCKNVKVILNLNPAEPCVDMQTTIFIKSKNLNLSLLTDKVIDKIEQIKKYTPYYELIIPPKEEDGILIMGIKVRGNGDYLPEYAGNLDIINSAAIEVTKILNKNEKHYNN